MVARVGSRIKDQIVRFSGKRKAKDHPAPPTKCPTGIRGLDELTAGGLPKGRPTLVCGGAGCGKTLLAVEFLVRGATQYDEPGVLVVFEESAQDVASNVASLGLDLDDLVARKLLRIDYIRIDPVAPIESGDYSLEGLFVRIKSAIDEVGAKRIALDSIENLFGTSTSDFLVRSELRRLFAWLKDLGLTAIITGERGEGELTRRGIEEYVSDCVILLDHRVSEQMATRRLRVVKYRGSRHGTNEYPFMIDDRGIVVVPLTSLQLEQPVCNDFVSTGLPQLDEMLGGRGYYSGSTVLISGCSGTGKTSLASSFVNHACRQGSRALYFAYEESAHQIQRGMSSIGLELEKWVRLGRLRFHCVRPHYCGLEMHLAALHNAILEFDPQVVVMDPATDLSVIGTEIEVRSTLTRIIDFCKSRGLTAVITALHHDVRSEAASSVGISSLIDTWIEVRDVEQIGERNRAIYVRKARGIAHSNQVREFLITSKGLRLVDVCIGPEGLLTGSARASYEEHLAGEQAVMRRRTETMSKELLLREEILSSRIAALKSEFESERSRMETEFAFLAWQEETNRSSRDAVAQTRTRAGGHILDASKEME
ncbi:MAG: circadian clock protein KaiC [Acidobacteria bacterium]|nr:circadian clock protein KaiC [Acidobacteriota bacterium]